MTGRGPAVLVRALLGSLFRNEDRELIGSIELDPAIRRPRNNGGRDAEILLEVDPAWPAPSLTAHLDACAARIRQALDHLPGLKHYAISNAPSGWVRHYTTRPGPPLPDLLFLEGIHVSLKLDVSLAFDFGDLDLLTVRLDHHSNGTNVFLES